MDKKPTNEELILLYELVKRKIYPELQYKFDRIHVDFCFPNEKLVIEIDGGYHLTKDQRITDNNRDAFIQREGFVVQRFSTEQVNESPEKIAYRIADLINTRKESTKFGKVQSVISNRFNIIKDKFEKQAEKNQKALLEAIEKRDKKIKQNKENSYNCLNCGRPLEKKGNGQCFTCNKIAKREREGR